MQNGRGNYQNFIEIYLKQRNLYLCGDIMNHLQKQKQYLKYIYIFFCLAKLTSCDSCQCLTNDNKICSTSLRLPPTFILLFVISGKEKAALREDTCSLNCGQSIWIISSVNFHFRQTNLLLLNKLFLEGIIHWAQNSQKLGRHF